MAKWTLQKYALLEISFWSDIVASATVRVLDISSRPDELETKCVELAEEAQDTIVNEAKEHYKIKDIDMYDEDVLNEIGATICAPGIVGGSNDGKGGAWTIYRVAKLDLVSRTPDEG